MNEQYVVWALENAVRYKGKAQPNAIIGKLINEDTNNRTRIKEFMPEIQQALQYVNKLSQEEQKKQLQEKNPAFFEKKEHDLFAFLNIGEEDAVVTAFPPGPEKYPHIGHAKAILLNYELAKQHKGKFILRFEDTNPKLVKEEFYHIMLDNFKWLGVHPDEVIYASDYMHQLLDFAKQLIDNGNAYVDKSSQEEIRQGRETGTPSKYRDMSIDEQQQLWTDFQTAEPGTMVVRLKIDLQHKNSTMRDPNIFRIITEPHARHGDKYRTWPAYDFQNAILDGLTGVTHRLRSIEFEMRNELHAYIRKLFDLTPTTTYEFGRFNMEGTESSGRIIREKIEKGELWGWDDPSLTTLVALKRRGFQPLAIKNFLFKTGITKNTATLTWDDLYRENTKIMDARAKRLFFVEDPVDVHFEQPEQTISVRMHPQEELGTRTFNANGTYVLAKQDVEHIDDQDIVRLMHNCTIKKEADYFTFLTTDNNAHKANKTVHWLPKQQAKPAKIIMPNQTEKHGLIEHTIEQLQEGDCFQCERFGNVRFDGKDGDTYVLWFTN